MRIAYVGNFSQQHCTETHLAATLEDLGHTVQRIQEDQTRQPNWVNRIDQGTDLFLYTRTWGKMVTLRDLETIRSRGIVSASYHLDLYVGLKREDGLENDPFWRTDFVFTPDGSKQAAEVFKRKGISHYYIKPGVFKPECHMTDSLGDGDYRGQVFKHEVIFVGGGSPTGEGPQYGHSEWEYRGQLLKFLKDTYGERYAKYGWPQETIRNDALNQLYADSKIAVGDSLCLSFDHPYYWSDRIYETLGRGGFMIHPFIEGMQEEFTDGDNIVFYEFNNWAQLKEKIDYYLEHNEERERIRRAGHEFVKNNATYHDRLSQMLDIVFKPKDDWQPTEGGGYTSPSLNMSLNSYMKAHENDPLKISLGAGTEIEEEEGVVWLNTDIVKLPGIDEVHNLMHFPYPFEDNSADFIKAKDIIEHLATHLPDGRNTVVAFIEECHRILKPGGTLWIQTPRYDAEFLYIDPTHTRGFHEQSFDFFDDSTDFGRSTGFYSKVKFGVKCKVLENKNLQFTMVKI